MRIPSTYVAVAFILVACGDDTGGGTTGGGSGGASSASGATNGPGATTSSSPGSTGSGDGGGTGGEAEGPAPSSSQSGSSTGAGAGPSDGSCATLDVTLCVTFEDAADGTFPDGWKARGDEWGEGVLGVASDDARFGSKSLKADGGNNGQHFMDYAGDLGSLASHHYGRVFMRVASPAPVAAPGTVLHADFIEGLGPGPGDSNHNVRWGTVGNDQGFHQWIFNVQPSNGDPEFGEGTSYDYTWDGAWECIEWYYDEPSQDGTLWIDGVDLGIVPGTSHAAEIPVFTSLGVGLANYQPAGEGFTVWFDELAYDDDTRIGCGD
jgi:hypothetical protein